MLLSEVDSWHQRCNSAFCHNARIIPYKTRLKIRNKHLVYEKTRFDAHMCAVLSFVPLPPSLLSRSSTKAPPLFRSSSASLLFFSVLLRITVSLCVGGVLLISNPSDITSPKTPGSAVAAFSGSAESAGSGGVASEGAASGETAYILAPFEASIPNTT